MTFLIIFLFIYAIIVTRIAYVGHKKVAKLFQEKQILIAEKGKLSNAMRKKGLEASNLKNRIRRLKRELDK